MKLPPILGIEHIANYKTKINKLLINDKFTNINMQWNYRIVRVGERIYNKFYLG